MGPHTPTPMLFPTADWSRRRHSLTHTHTHTHCVASVTEWANVVASHEYTCKREVLVPFMSLVYQSMHLSFPFWVFVNCRVASFADHLSTKKCHIKCYWIKQLPDIAELERGRWKTKGEQKGVKLEIINSVGYKSTCAYNIIGVKFSLKRIFVKGLSVRYSLSPCYNI